MNTKLLGGILLIVGTAIGGGMLALPIATSQAGFLHSTLLLFVCWFIMTTGAFLILEVNLWLPANSNIISMAGATLGKAGQVVAWASYLLLLYSLLAAYMAGGGDFLHNLCGIAGLHLPGWVTILLFASLLSVIVYFGIRSVDYVNRGLMLTKLGSYIILVICILPFVTKIKLLGGEFKYITASFTVAITSFGFAAIVPSLRTYFNNDIPKLRKAIIIGSLIPLACYIAWDFAIMGVIPRDGSNGLIAILHSGHSTSDFVNALNNLIRENIIVYMARIFSSICLATSFLGVALSLFDFLADGLRLNKSGWDNFKIYSATFLPPLLIVLFYPKIFITALNYAGIYCTILLVLLPSLMAWWGRYRKNISTGKFQVKGGKPLLIFLIVVSIFLIGQGIVNAIH